MRDGGWFLNTGGVWGLRYRGLKIKTGEPNPRLNRRLVTAYGPLH
jgi:hypothetical protein